MFVVNPYLEPGLERYWVPSVVESALFGTKIADDLFQIHAGGDIPFFYGVLKHLIESNWVDREFIAHAPSAGARPKPRSRSLSWEALERGSGLTRADMFRFAEAFGKARHAIIVWSMGITQHAYGSDNVRAIVNLQLAQGQHRPRAHRPDADPRPQRRAGRRRDGRHARRVRHGLPCQRGQRRKIRLAGDVGLRAAFVERA